MQEPQTDFGKSLRRIFFLLQVLMWEFEWAAMDEKISPERRKKLIKYKDKFINWVRVDLLTSTPNINAIREVVQHITSEHAKDISLWLDMGIDCSNLDEVMNVLKQCVVKPETTNKNDTTN